MTNFETFSAVAAFLGLVLGVVNTAWMILTGRPRLRITPHRGAAFFPANFLIEHPYRNAPDKRPGVVAHVRLEISNPSRRDNTVVSVQCEADVPLRQIAAEEQITSGTKTIDLTPFLGPGHVFRGSVSWPVPSPLWPDIVPCAIDAGACKVGHLAFELQTEPQRQDHLMLRIRVRDSHGRTYRKDVCLKRTPTSSHGPIRSIEAVSESEEAGSIRTGGASPKR